MIEKITKKAVDRAARIIQNGGIVAFPTETVYGLGANALSKNAVKKIFKAKGRPSDNPLIVHISDFNDLEKLVKNIPKETEILAKNFWPGPLTLIFEAKNIIPKEVSGGGSTIAIRIPKNKIALELIKKTGLPIAAPSANLSGKPSPTSAQHVLEDLKGKIDLILDGGKTRIGLESTVLDLTTKPFQILRSGSVSLGELKKVIKSIKYYTGKKSQTIKSPGMKYRHYAPEAELILIYGNQKKMISEIQFQIKKYRNLGKKVGVLSTIESKNKYKKADVVLSVGSIKKPENIARNLFAVLRNFDKKVIDIILAETFSEKGIGVAIMNRLKRATKK